MIFVSLL